MWFIIEAVRFQPSKPPIEPTRLHIETKLLSNYSSFQSYKIMLCLKNIIVL